MNSPYFIDSVTYPDDTSNGTIGTAVISCNDHYDCITILGTKHELTERIIRVLKGLNEK